MANATLMHNREKSFFLDSGAVDMLRETQTFHVKNA